MTPSSRTLIYAAGLVLGVLGLIAAVIAGLLDGATAKELGLWLAGILGTTAAGVATAHRPTRPPTD